MLGVMVQKTQIIYEDDVDGSEAHETVQFGLDGAQYEIDLSDKNAGKLRDALRPFLEAARKTRASAKSPVRKETKVDTRAVREWAASNGLDVNKRGRIPADVIEKFKAAGH
jgi:hypothetical protein